MSSEPAHSTINSDRRFVAHAGLVTRRIGEETILVPVSSRVGDLDAIYTLTEVGSSVWALLREPVSVRQIADVLCDEYDVSSDVALKDAAEFLDALLDKNLINVADKSEG
jgi:hypothetical protein